MLNAQTFPCPGCNEIISDAAQVCRYCSAPIDKQAAEVAAELQSKVNQACSDASYLKITAVAMFSFVNLSLIPFLPLVYFGFIFTFFAVIVMALRWQQKFGRLQTNDPDYAIARRAKNIAMLLWVLALPIGFVLRPLLSFG